jgi:hypothetical protein
MDVDCSDGNDCTGDVCAPADGSCSNPNETDGTACDFSGAPGVCMSGTCEDDTVDLCMGVDCSDGNECTEDVCAPADGSCSNPNETDGTACDFSGADGVCMSGTCEDAMLCNGVDCSDGNDCTEDLCDPADGSCSNPNETDGTVCDASGSPGTCQTGVCVGLCDGVDCSDGNDCTEDVCDPADGSCSNPNETDDTVCEFSSGVGGVCRSGTCEDAMLCEDVDCSDGNDCTEDVCDPADGSCSNPDDVDICSDDNECTQDVCDSADGSCSNPNLPHPTECEFLRGVAGICDGAGTCLDAMLCEDVDCSDGNECTEDVCDRADGSCSNPDVDCSDGNECTQDVCDSADGSCSNPNVPHPTVCEFSSGVAGVCDGAGTCVDAMLCEDVDCSDGKDCTEDVCDRADGSCSNPNETDGTACDFSGVGGVCMSGTCVDAMLCEDVDCSDGKDCTEDVCDRADGSCSNPIVDCSDGNECTEDVCNPAGGLCSNPNVPHPTVCEFSSGVAGVCDGAGTCLDAMLCEDVDCSDGNDCTEDVCDRADGSCSNPNVDLS